MTTSARTRLAFAALALAAPAAFAAESAGSAVGSVVQMIIGLVIVLGILLGGAWLLRRFVSLPVTTNSPLKIVTGLSLSPRDRLVVVQVGEKQVLLGLSPGRIATLHVLEQPLDINTNPDSPISNLGQRFGALLQSQMKK
jgi:flagellar protein FliO/FliZ